MNIVDQYATLKNEIAELERKLSESKEMLREALAKRGKPCELVRSRKSPKQALVLTGEFYSATLTSGERGTLNKEKLMQKFKLTEKQLESVTNYTTYEIIQFNPI